MKSYKVNVCVIGAGVTGLSISLDLAKLGISCIVVNQDTLNLAASLNFAGVLHSGARYAITDFPLAKLCAESSRALLQKVPFAIVDRTKAYYIGTDISHESYAEDLIDSCQMIGINPNYVAPEDVLKNEPHLTKDIKFALEIPDYVLDPVILLKAYIEQLEKQNVKILKNTSLTGISFTNEQWNIEVKEHQNEQLSIIKADLVVVAAGAWSADVLKLFGVNILFRYISGSMAVIPQKLVKRIISFCEPSSSGDSIIPSYNSTLIGSTWRQQEISVPTPAIFPEVKEIVHKASQGLQDFNFNLINHTYSAVRIAFDENHMTGIDFIDRKKKRDYHILDCEKLYSVKRLISVFGGKFTLYNTMSKSATHLVCDKIKADFREDLLEYNVSPPTQKPDFHLGSVEKHLL
ncbi:MAG: FAD-dependent oxidoreductase [Stigonema ocellatum SAG 48.90 = DSM 106950]|nr:FAD-dependent oxidoreductase [Stigonema ocellatum SAG 48.90 = DSM 106950]